MDEQQPVERREVVERHETTLRTPAGSAREISGRRGSFTWLWILLLALLVGALAWYALSRGERQRLEMPEVEAPALELPA